LENESGLVGVQSP